jgi:RNA polymerase sigma factor (sigma-70 family)
MKEQMTDCYNDCVSLVRSTAWEFSRKYGMDFEELYSICNCAFVSAYLTYDGEKSKFTTWLRRLMWHDMCNHVRSEMRLNRAKNDNYSGTQQKPNYDVIDLIDELDSDIKNIVQLISDAPKELLELSVLEPKKSKKHLREYLQKIGWTKTRIKNAFHKIRELV